MAGLRHPLHQALLKPYNFSGDEEDSLDSRCDLCLGTIVDASSRVVYRCEECRGFIHALCAKAPLTIQHPFHYPHTLDLVHGEFQPRGSCLARRNAPSEYRCGECKYYVPLERALCTLPDEVSCESQPEVVESLLTAHVHPLNPFIARWGCMNCDICGSGIEVEGYICLSRECDFVIHRVCLRYLRYEDGTWIPQVRHRHQLTVFHAIHNPTNTKCCHCDRSLSGEYIACQHCNLFYHRECADVPSTLQHPLFPNSLLTLWASPFDGMPYCQHCDRFVHFRLAYMDKDEHVLLHVGCALRTLEFCEKGGRAEIFLHGHENPFLLCYRTNEEDRCDGCGEIVKGLAYRLDQDYCKLLLHESCVQQLSTLKTPHHPRHPLTLFGKDKAFISDSRKTCGACDGQIYGFHLCCLNCAFFLEIRCFFRLATKKHYLHEHDLTYFDEILSWECYVCETTEAAPIFRCVSCDFNIHQKCMELPHKVKHHSHFHEMTLWESYADDDSGEYYCDFCEKRRDGRLGVYVCEECKLRSKLVAHIECVLPHMKRERKDDPLLKKFENQNKILEEEILATKNKLEALTEQLKLVTEEHAKLELSARGECFDAYE